MDRKFQSKTRSEKNPKVLVAQMIKNLPAKQETWVWSLDWEDLLEEGMETHSSILVFLPKEFPWTEEPGRVQSMGSQRVRTRLNNLAHTVLSNPNYHLSLLEGFPVGVITWSRQSDESAGLCHCFKHLISWTERSWEPKRRVIGWQGDSNGQGNKSSQGRGWGRCFTCAD